MNRITRLEYLHELAAADGSPEAVLRPVKDLTFAHASAFQDAFFDYVKEGRTTIKLELSNVTFVDSGGIGTLVKLRKSLEGSGGALVLLNPGKTVQNILKLVGLSPLVKFEEDAAKTPGSVSSPSGHSGVFTRPARVQIGGIGEDPLPVGFPAPGGDDEVDAHVDRLILEADGGHPEGSKQARVEVKENVTYLNAQSLLDGLLANLSKGITQVRVDVAKVEFIDSAGVGMLLKAAKAFNGAGGELILVTPTVSLQRILKIVKLDRVLKIES